jgi:FAD synthetase
MNKIIDFSDVGSFLDSMKFKGRLVVVGGCFDILHKGHFRFLEEAKKTGNILIVILESDESVRRRKGNSRPVNNLDSRAKSLAKMSDVDFVLKIPDFKKDKDYYNLVKKLQPDIIAVTKNDPLYSKKSEQAKIVGGKILEVIDLIPNLSTTGFLSTR